MFSPARKAEGSFAITDRTAISHVAILGRSVMFGGYASRFYIRAAAKTLREDVGNGPGQRGLSDPPNGGAAKEWRIAP